MREKNLIELIKRKCPSNASILFGIDDDAAVIRPQQNPGLVCSDMLMEGVHFLLNEASPQAIGHKALAVNLSDIAAMGGRAWSAYVSLALPRTRIDESFISGFYEGMGALARTFDVAIAGGDTNIWDGPLVVNVTVVGEAHAKGVLLRSGAKSGDKVFVTGPLGGSLEGHHLAFVPRLFEAKALMDNFEISSMMDISDGLGKDLREISRQSSVAFALEKSSIPLRGNIAFEKEALRRAFCDGEDFELCFTLSREEAERLRQTAGYSYCKEIGEVREGSGLYWQDDGSEITWQGYEHGGRI